MMANVENQLSYNFDLNVIFENEKKSLIRSNEKRLITREGEISIVKNAAL
jgi:hypothetical protein